MHLRRLAALLLGAWLAGSVFMSWVATGNFASVDRVIQSGGATAQQRMKEIGVDRARLLLRFHSSEQNRHYFYQWEIAQLILGVVLPVVLLFGTNGERLVMITSALMLAIVAIVHWTITPQIIELGRVIDFAGPQEMANERRVFWNYHRAYSTLEVAKLGLGLVLGVRLLASFRPSRRRRRVRGKVHQVDHTNHSHVDG